MTTEPITTLDQLKDRYTQAMKIARDERRWRQKVFANKPALLAAKTAEMDLLIATLEAMKDALKQRLISEEYQQAPLIEVPAEASKERRAEFN